MSEQENKKRGPK